MNSISDCLFLDDNFYFKVFMHLSIFLISRLSMSVFAFGEEDLQPGNPNLEKRLKHRGGKCIEKALLETVEEFAVLLTVHQQNLPESTNPETSDSRLGFE